MKRNKITRRKFVAGTTSATVGAMIVPRHVLGGVGYNPPSDTVNVAIIGCGGQGKTDAVELVTGGQNIVALADVDFAFVDREVAERTKVRPPRTMPNMTEEQLKRAQENAEKGAKEMLKLQEAYGKAKRYADFRKMLEQKDIDAVLVATPDHTHAVIAKAAMELGKHAYVEKPLTWSINEARVLRETAARTKVITQMGNMGHSSEGAALVNEWVQAGVIGPVKQVYVWTNRPLGFWPQGIPRPGKAAPATASGTGGISGAPIPQGAPQGGGQGGPGGGMGFGTDWNARTVNKALAQAMDGDYPVPKDLNWDLFLGPAPEVPYHPIYHPFNWRGWLDWGTGAIGDMAAHLIDHPYWALGLNYPTSVEATFTPWGTDLKNVRVTYPMGTHVVYKYPARGSQPPVTITWMDGGLMPGRPDVLPENVQLDPGGGAIFVGEKGILVHGTYAANPKLYPESLMEVAAKVPKTYFRVEKTGEGQFAQAKHRMNWIKAIKGTEKATCPFDYATRLTENMLLGVVAMKTGQGRRIYYDGEAGKITNVQDANQHLGREYRKGWTL